MESYPIFFSFTNIIKTMSYHAAVTTKGRALLIHHSDGSWVCSGVEPGGLDSDGDQSLDAVKLFAKEFQLVLEDIAEEASNYLSFVSAVDVFFKDKNREAEELWNESVSAIQSGKAEIDPSLVTMERKPDAGKREVTVTMLKNLTIPESFNDQVVLAAEFKKAA